jgi:hypothetical protein
VKAAVEDAAGVSLPSPGWKLKVALAVDANPELKAAVAQVEQNYVASEEVACRDKPRVINPFIGMTSSRRHHRGGCRLVVAVLAFFILLSMLGHHHHSKHGSEDSQPDHNQDGQDSGSEDGGQSNPLGFFFGLAIICFAMSCCTLLCSALYKKCCARAPAVAVTVEDEPNIVPSSVVSGTVTSFTTTAKYVELEKGTCKL